MFGKKDENVRRETRNVNVTPALNYSPTGRSQPETSTSNPLPSEPPTPAVKPDDTKGSKLIVGPDIKLKGVEITDCDTLVVEGLVEAAMDSRVIQIAERGVFSGTVGIDVAEIRGRFEGELTARKQLVIHSTGRVSGKIRYGKITVEEGGVLAGDIGAISASAAGNTTKAVDLKTAPAVITAAYDPFSRQTKSF